MSTQNGSDVTGINPEDYTHIVVIVRGGCVQGARRDDGTPVLVTVHDYDVHEEDVSLLNHDITTDEQGEYYERLIA